MLKKILKDALPTMISLTMSGMYSVVDGLFIGKATGDVGLAAINIAWPIPAVITAIGIGIGAGGSVLMSNARGQNQLEESKKICDNLVSFLILAGVLITAVFFLAYPRLLGVLGADGAVFSEAEQYCEVIVICGILQIVGTGLIPVLRNMGMSLYAMIAMLTGFTVNLFMNYYLMFGLHMGIRGAAIGTVAAQGVVIVMAVPALHQKAKYRYHFLFEKQVIQKICAVGITAFGLSMAPTVALIFTNLQCLRYGGNEAVACYAVISYIVFPVQYMLTGVGDGVQPLMSFYNGAAKFKELAIVRKTAYQIVIVIGIAATGIVFLLSGKIGLWFGLSEKAGQYFIHGMRISAVGFVLLGITKFNIAYLNATLNTNVAMILTYAESLIVSPCLLFLLPLVWKMTGIWLALPITAVWMLGGYFIWSAQRNKIRKNCPKEEGKKC